MKIKNPFKTTFNEQYELAFEIGKKRFGSSCKHGNVKGRICQDCKRTVVSNLGLK